MKNISRFRDVLTAQKKSKIIPLKIEKQSLLYYSSEKEEERRLIHHKVIESLYRCLDIPGLLLRPGHKSNREFDHLEIRVIDNNENHISLYLNCVEKLPTLCAELNIPYIESDTRKDVNV